MNREIFKANSEINEEEPGGLLFVNKDFYKINSFWGKT